MNIQIPFTIKLTDNNYNKQLICRQIVRYMPGKRLVCLSEFNGQDVYVKLFIHPRDNKRHFKREQTGIEAMEKRGIQTPPLLFAGGFESSDPLFKYGYIIILKAIANSISLKQKWLDAELIAEKTEILKTLVQTILLHHKKGILQNDLHLGNFLFTKQEIYTLDGDTVTTMDTPIKNNIAIRNFGLLFAQVPPYFDKTASILCYDEKNVALLQASITKQRNRRKKRYLNKIMRNCTAFVQKKYFKKLIIHNRSFSGKSINDLLENPETFIMTNKQKFLKQGNTSTVTIVKAGEKTIIVKRYNIKNFFHGLSHALRRTRAEISWKNAHLLQMFDIPTPVPQAMIEQRLGPIRMISYFITDFIEGVDARTYFFSKDISIDNKKEVAQKIIKIIQSMIKSKLSHGDMKATNFLIAGKNVFITDLDSMRQHSSKKVFDKYILKDIKRLLENWEHDTEILQIFLKNLNDIKINVVI